MSSSGSDRPSSEAADDGQVKLWTLQGNVCAVLAALAWSDLNASQIRENNGVYLVALLTLTVRQSL